MISDLFKTKEEAQKFASNYGYIGAHKMGNKWIPCKNAINILLNKNSLNINLKSLLQN